METKYSFFRNAFWLSSFAISLPQCMLASSCGELTVQLGGFKANQSSHHINIEGLAGDDFHDTSSNLNLLVGLGAYFNGLNYASTRTLFGINAFYLAPAQVRGKIKQEGLFTNLAYRYSWTNYPIYFATKTLICCNPCYDVALDLGIGPNIVSTKNFREKSLDGGITIPQSHLFSGKSIAVFSASAGVGLRIKNVFKGLAFEIDYRFFYLGQGHLKKTNSQLKNNLRTGSYANALFLSISI